MTQTQFKELIQTVERDTQTKCSPAFGNLSLIPKYLKMDYSKFKKICKWLGENYEAFGSRFPNIANFERARKETSSYSPSTFTKYSNTEYLPEEMEKAFNDVKKKLPKRKVNNEKKKSQVQLMIQMEKEGRVYSVNECRWILKKFKDKVPGAIIDPEGTLKRYDITSMNNLI